MDMTRQPVRQPGLRERKKARTRAEIRSCALRLFLAQGYEATTVQQIAEAADVSLSTLFRYFPTKAQLVLPADLATLVRDAVGAQASDGSVFQAVGSGLRASFAELSALPGDGNPEEERAAGTLARARDALLGEATGAVGMLAEIVGERWGREPHDPLVQAAAGAIVGIGIAAWSADRDLGRERALEILDVGLHTLDDGFRP